MQDSLPELKRFVLAKLTGFANPPKYPKTIAFAIRVWLSPCRPNPGLMYLLLHKESIRRLVFSNTVHMFVTVNFI